MSTEPVPGMPVDLGVLTRRPWATFLWGDSRPVINRVLYALARANDPSPYWLDIRSEGEATPGPGPVELGWIPEDHLFVTRQPAEARPQNRIDEFALWSVVRADEPMKVVARLSDFLRLPSIAQEIIAEMGSAPGAHVVAVANSDRVRAYYPTVPEGIRPVLTPFLDAGLYPFFGATSTPGEARWAFDFVFEVRAARLSSWESGWLVCEKAPVDTPFRRHETIPLRAVHEIAGALREHDEIP
jgi:hypothetical protein